MRRNKNSGNNKFKQENPNPTYDPNQQMDFNDDQLFDDNFNGTGNIILPGTGFPNGKQPKYDISMLPKKQDTPLVVELAQPAPPKQKSVVPTVAITATGKYALHLSVLYETIFGESISVLGSVEELGKWKEYKINLSWTEGNVWVTKSPIILDKPYFSYKYILMENGEMTKWEFGIDRIADLRILP